MGGALWTHKFKTLAFIVLLYFARKGWLLYQTYVRPFLDMAKQLKDDGKATPKKEAEEVEVSDYYEEVDCGSDSSCHEDPQS
jgi:hypothetical protein